MKLAPLLALSLAGCSLYFGSGDPQLTDPPDPSAPGGDPAPDPGGGPLPEKSCGKPEVHILSVYETRSDHSSGNHPTGAATVRIDRPGDHALVLSAYEPTSWTVTLGAGAHIESVTLIGYHDQHVNLTGIPVEHDQGCGYSWPYNGGGCDTNHLLEVAKQHTGADLTTFHGCYHASDWTLHADGSASSNCDTAAGYEVDELIADCDGGGGGDGKWEKSDFTTLTPPACHGDRYVRFDAHYNKFVGAILCGDSRHYKLYMNDSLSTPFLEIADYAGHGQDHCELVNPAFTIPNEDDITSGGCLDCSVGQVVDIDGVPVYARAKFGEPFERVTARYWADLTNPVYSCGVAIP